MEFNKEEYNNLSKEDKRYILDSYFSTKETFLNQQTQLALTLISVVVGLLVVATFSNEVFSFKSIFLLKMIISILLLTIPVTLWSLNADINKAAKYIDSEIGKLIDINVKLSLWGRINKVLPGIVVHTIAIVIVFIFLMIWISTK